MECNLVYNTELMALFRIPIFKLLKRDFSRYYIYGKEVDNHCQDTQTVAANILRVVLIR